MIRRIEARVGLRQRIAGVGALLLLANLAAWAWAWLAFHGQPVLLGTAWLAWGFGLRHAVDADHIAAIDNATRKLMQQGKRPVATGLFFALGHSTVVFLAASAVAGTAAALAGPLQRLAAVGSVLGSAVSALFLFAIAFVNLAILRDVWRTLRAVREGAGTVSADPDPLHLGTGPLARVLRPLFRLVGESWHMYPLGFLFGLGFDTATEIALLGASAAAAAKGISFWSIMVFPALFAAGMSAIDAADGIVMLRAYDWAFLDPIRKLYYNLTVTLLSVVVAVLIGGIEVLGELSDALALKGRFWDGVGALNDNFTTLGTAVIGLFIAAWMASAILWRRRNSADLRLAAPER